MRTPSSALPARPHGFVLGRGRPLPDFLTSFTTFFEILLADFFSATLDFDLVFFFVAIVSSFFVMPAKAGIQYTPVGRRLLGPRFRGDDSKNCVIPFFLSSWLCGLRLPMRPPSRPAAGSITALISVGLPESIAALTARLSSSGEVALTPVPPNASIIFS